LCYVELVKSRVVERVMRRVLGIIVVAVCTVVLALGGSFHANAARDLTAPKAGAVTQEIVVFETDNCAYCGAFRDQVMPRYRQSPRSLELPIRFVDVNEADVSKMKLIAPIQIVPTMVMVRGGQEVDRISGYTGPENFFILVGKMLSAD
jgi:thioredoxin-related protein